MDKFNRKENGKKFHSSLSQDGIFPMYLALLTTKIRSFFFIFFYYKKSFSIILLALCDTEYEFTLVDIGDGSVYADRFLFHVIESNHLNLPKVNELLDSNKPLHTVLLEMMLLA